MHYPHIGEFNKGFFLSHAFFSFVRKKPISKLSPCTKFITNLESRTNSQWNVLDNAFTLPSFQTYIEHSFLTFNRMIARIAEIIKSFDREIVKVILEDCRFEFQF